MPDWVVVGGRHIDRAVSGWKDNNLSPATMANRVSHLRWLSQKINKQNIVPRTNRELGIGRRSYVAQVDQSQQLPNQATMNQFTQRQQLSMQLAREFGLRREESLKFQVNVADKGDRVDLLAPHKNAYRSLTLGSFLALYFAY